MINEMPHSVGRSIGCIRSGCEILWWAALVSPRPTLMSVNVASKAWIAGIAVLLQEISVGKKTQAHEKHTSGEKDHSNLDRTSSKDTETPQLTPHLCVLLGMKHFQGVNRQLK